MGKAATIRLGPILSGHGEAKTAGGAFIAHSSIPFGETLLENTRLFLGAMLLGLPRDPHKRVDVSAAVTFLPSPPSQARSHPHLPPTRILPPPDGSLAGILGKGCSRRAPGSVAALVAALSSRVAVYPTSLNNFLAAPQPNWVLINTAWVGGDKNQVALQGCQFAAAEETSEQLCQTSFPVSRVLRYLQCTAGENGGKCGLLKINLFLN